MALIQKAFSDIITFSRSSNATRIGPTGLVEYAPHNLLTYSQQFDNASWNKSNVSVTANTTAAPDGSVTADQVTVTTASFPNINQSAGTLAATQHTVSFFVKAGTSNWMALQLSDGVANANGRYFDASSAAVGGGVGLSSGSAVTVASSTATSVGNGWVRCSITFNISNATTYAVVLYIVDGNNSTSVTNGRTISFWGAQLAVGPYALDYTPTTSAAVYGPRFDFDPVTLAPKGLLVEEQRTNLLTYSEQFDNAAWVKSGTTVTANAAAAPNGTVTADLVTANTSSSFGFLYSNNIASGVFTTSVYAKQGTQRYIQFLSTATTAYWANFDLQDGLAYAGGTTSSVSIVSVGNGWYRCSLSVTDSNSNQPTIGFVTSLNSARAPSTTLTTNCYLWGAQLEAGSFATSYIPTIASTVTRSADVASVNTLSPWFNATESTIYSEFDTFSTNDAFPYAMGTKNNNEIDVYRVGSNGNVATLMFASTVLQNNSTIATGTALNATIKAAYAIKANDLAGSANGGAAVTDTTATLPSVSTLYLGARDDGSGALNGHLRRLAVYPRRLTNAEIQALTS
jgi:hypothetical protein